MKDDLGEAKARRDECSARFYYTYYTVSLPYTLAGIAIASYPYPENPNPELVAVEIGGWLLFYRQERRACEQNGVKWSSLARVKSSRQVK